MPKKTEVSNMEKSEKSPKKEELTDEQLQEEMGNKQQAIFLKEFGKEYSPYWNEATEF